ncbi:MAG: amino acid synthesis family protein [Pseudolabrys sp.]|nr:amino acid synthesis family protein [Pseudolabrys sp.]
MSDLIRKVVVYVEHVWKEGGQSLEPKLKMIGAAAVITNPWYGKGFVQDLKPEILKDAMKLGQELANKVVEAAGGGENVEAYGKAALIGAGGEIEHGRAFIHQLRFGNRFRDAVGAKSYLNFANTRGAPGAAIHIPLLNKNDDTKRSHFITIQMCVPDAPAHNELVIALGATTGPSPNHRIGDRFKDIEEMKADPSHGT